MKNAAATFSCSEKHHQEVFSEIGILKIIASHNGLYKILIKSLRNL